MPDIKERNYSIKILFTEDEHLTEENIDQLVKETLQMGFSNTDIHLKKLIQHDPCKHEPNTYEPCDDDPDFARCSKCGHEIFLG